MSDRFTCDDNAELVAYLYDELDPAVRRRVEDHLRVCAGCADEVRALDGVRRALAQWTPPEAALGFQVVQARAADTPAAGVVRRARWGVAQPMPTWARAAAAVFVVGLGLGAANLHVRYGADGLVVTTGWMAPVEAPQPAAVATGPAAQGPAEWQQALAALESSLRREIRASRTAEAAAPSRGEVSLQRVSALIAASERRQQQELARRLAMFGRDLEVQRRADLVRINQGFGQFEGRAGAEIARQGQMLDYIMRVSAPRPPQ